MFNSDQYKTEPAKNPGWTRDDRKVDGCIEDLVGCLADPIIVMPGGWGDTLPEWIRGQIKIERLLENMVANHEKRELMATDAEAVAYLYTASLEAPIGRDWTQIYLYVAGKTMRAYNKVAELPDDVRVDKLTPDQERDLKKLKVWIYERRVKARKDKARGIRTEDDPLPGGKKAVPAPKDEPVLMQSMFKF